MDRTPTRWDGVASEYDRWFDETWGRFAFRVEAGAVRRCLSARPALRVLDAGCGTGRFTAALGSAGAVIGVDVDAAMLSVAAKRLPGRCGRARVEALPFPDGAFDVTLAVTVLEFVADPVVVMAELVRVTRPGGRIIVGALNPRSPWGLANRRRLRTGVWCQARFLTRRQLRQVATPYGRATLHGALHTPRSIPGLARLGPILELAGRVVPTFGAFQVLVVDKATP